MLSLIQLFLDCLILKSALKLFRQPGNFIHRKSDMITLCLREGKKVLTERR
jgi:hypothetical protein